MSKLVEVSLKNIVKRVSGLELDFYDAIDITKNVVCYRFGNEDEVHLLIDGVGGYTLIINPDNPELKKETSGHLGDFKTDIVEK